MLDLSKLFFRVKKDLLSYCEENGIKNPEYLSAEEAFCHFLEWNGIIGYTLTIITALDSLREAEIKTKRGWNV